MTKKYIINGREIERINGGIIDFGGFKSETLTGVEAKINELLDALDEKKEEYQECQWENCSDGRYCEKHSLETEPKSTLREEGRKMFEELTQHTISVVKTYLLKEIERYDKEVRGGTNRISREDIEGIIKNL